MQFLNLLASGYHHARRNRRLVLIAWLVPLLPALLLALMVTSNLGPVLDRSLFSEAVLDGNGFAVWADFSASPANMLGPILSRGVVMFFVLSALFQIMLAAGIVEVLAGSESRHQFTLGVRRNAWPFLRGAAFLALCTIGVAIIARLVVKGGSHLATAMPDGRFTIAGLAGAGLVALLLYAPLDLAYDLSRIASVRHGERSMVRGLLRALGTVLRMPLLFAPLYLLFVLLPMAVHLVYVTLRLPWSPAGWFAVILLLIVQQAVMGVRAFLKITFWGAELEVYRLLDEPRWCRKKEGAREACCGGDAAARSSRPHKPGNKRKGSSHESLLEFISCHDNAARHGAGVCVRTGPHGRGSPRGGRYLADRRLRPRRRDRRRRRAALGGHRHQLSARIRYGRRRRATGPDAEAVLTFEPVPGEEIQIDLVAGASPDEMWMQPRGTASRRRMIRTDALPSPCGEEREVDPLFVFDVFWQTFEEHYPFFEMKGVDWRAVRDRERPRVSAETTDDDLWDILQGILEEREDAHTYLATADMKKFYHGQRADPNPLDKDGRARAFSVIDESYLEAPPESRCNDQMAIGRLPGGVRYFRLTSFNGYGDDFLDGLDCLEGVLDDLLAEPESIEGLVIDVRINGGGSDPYGLAIASRLATAEYLAYTKETRNDPEDPNSWTEGQHSIVRPTTGVGFTGPVVELTGINSVSAAETFTMALIGRTPKVTRIGQNTQGVFSDVLGRMLPNGWRFGLSNERFLAEDGTNFEGPGIPPDIETPVFTPEELEARRDSAIEKAMEILTSGG